MAVLIRYLNPYERHVHCAYRLGLAIVSRMPALDSNSAIRVSLILGFLLSPIAGLCVRVGSKSPMLTKTQFLEMLCSQNDTSPGKKKEGFYAC